MTHSFGYQKVKAKRSRYGATVTRSRLEARWAAALTAFGWRWRYEPEKLAGWLPDFVIESKTTQHLPAAPSLYCEVKPVDVDDPYECRALLPVKAKIEKACWPGRKRALILGKALVLYADGGQLGFQLFWGEDGRPQWWPAHLYFGQHGLDVFSGGARGTLTRSGRLLPATLSHGYSIESYWQQAVREGRRTAALHG